MVLCRRIINKHFLFSMMITLGPITPVISLFIYFIILFMVLNWILIKYTTKITSVIVIWNLNCLIPPTDAEPMGGIRCIKQVEVSQCLKILQNQDFILTHCMISKWWVQLLEVLGHYLIQTRTAKMVLAITISLVGLGYTYITSCLRVESNILTKQQVQKIICKKILGNL